METLVEMYRKTYVKVMLELDQQGINTDQELGKNKKKHESEAKANVRDWVNQVTSDDSGFFAIHFACFLG